MKVNYTVKCFEPGTNSEIATTKVGNYFDLALFVNDIRLKGTYYNKYLDREMELERGLFAAYSNIQYDKNLSNVKVFEIQTLTFTGALTGYTNFSIGGKTSPYIRYDLSSSARRYLTASNIQSAINLILGRNSVKVTHTGLYDFIVEFHSFPGTDLPLIKPSTLNVKVVETQKGNIFNQLFRFSRNFQNGKNVLDIPTGIGELGAFSSDFTGHNGELVRVCMRANASGKQVFTPTLTFVRSPMYDTLVMGNLALEPPEDSFVEPSEIETVSAELLIV